MEEAALYQILQACMSSQDSRSACDDCEHAPYFLGRTTPPAYICPSAGGVKIALEGTASLEKMTKGNYAGCFGARSYSSFLTPTHAGAFGPADVSKYAPQGINLNSEGDALGNGPWKMGSKDGTQQRDITDGTSNTLFISEVLGYDSRKDIRGVWTNQALGASSFTAWTPPNAKPNWTGTDLPGFTEPVQGWDRTAGCDVTIPQTDPLYCGTQPETRGGNCATEMSRAAARSAHPGGVVAAMADGSVRFVGDAIDINVWRAMATRSGDEPIASQQ
jgi:prepilin-type processing-associated H-X9-DG protein